jgi:D-alanine-D-alanine ligase-like ATP-grasp enzyme
LDSATHQNHGSIVKARTRPRIVVIYNRDFEGAEADPENKAREDVKEIADHIVRILSANGYEASGLGVTSDVTGALGELRALKPAAVFNLCESIQGDNRFESLLPLLLELEGIPYTGSEPFALSLALRKEKVKEFRFRKALWFRRRATCLPWPCAFPSSSSRRARTPQLASPGRRWSPIEQP